MNSATSIESAIDPNNRLTFLLDWELTLKCNLDCDYCDTGIYGGHDNSTRHPELASCLRTIDFMFEYVQHKMQNRQSAFRHVVLNVYGGEALHHPDIVKILQQTRQRHEQYKSNWSLTVTTTTNAIVTPRILDQVIPLIDEFTVSYHTNNTDKQKQQFQQNLIRIRDAGRRLKCVVLMHAQPELFADAQQQIAWCDQHNIKTLPRQLDRTKSRTEFDYNTQQVVWFDRLYQQRSQNATTDTTETQDQTDMSSQGRSCCGGRLLCENQQYKQRKSFVTNKFTDWYCSVDQFFLFVKQVNGEVFVNKDCKMNYQGQVGPIGNLNDTQAMLESNGSHGVIKCAKLRCGCGLCAPKAQDLDTYNTIMRKYEIPNSNLLQKS